MHARGFEFDPFTAKVEFDSLLQRLQKKINPGRKLDIDTAFAYCQPLF